MILKVDAEVKKITDEFETKQDGSTSNYDVGDLGAGVYRYLVYGAQTGSGGETD